MTHEASRAWVLVLRGTKINLLLALGRSRKLLFLTNFRDEATTIKAKAESGLLARRGR